MEKIKITVHKVSESICGHIRITSAAERKLRELCREKGLSARYVASQIILQGADFVEFVGDGDEE